MNFDKEELDAYPHAYIYVEVNIEFLLCVKLGNHCTILAGAHFKA
jgi:hypothetical protein